MNKNKNYKKLNNIITDKKVDKKNNNLHYYFNKKIKKTDFIKLNDKLKKELKNYNFRYNINKKNIIAKRIKKYLNVTNLYNNRKIKLNIENKIRNNITLVNKLKRKKYNNFDLLKKKVVRTFKNIEKKGKRKNKQKKIFYFFKKRKIKRRLNIFRKRKYIKLKKEINKRIIELHYIITYVIFFDVKKKKKYFVNILNKVNELYNNKSTKKNNIQKIKKELLNKNNITLLNFNVDRIEKQNKLQTIQLIYPSLQHLSVLNNKLKKNINKKKYLNFYNRSKNIKTVNIFSKTFKNTKKNINKKKYIYDYVYNNVLNDSSMYLVNKKLIQTNNIFNILLKNKITNKDILKYLIVNTHNKRNNSLILLLDVIINNIIKKRYQLNIKKNKILCILKNKYKKRKKKDLLSNKAKDIKKIEIIKQKYNKFKLFKNWEIRKKLYKIKKWRKRIKKNIFFDNKYYKKFKKQIKYYNRYKLNIRNKKYLKNKYFNSNNLTSNKYYKNINNNKKKIILLNKLSKHINRKLFNLIWLKTMLLNTLDINLLSKINILFNNIISNKINKKENNLLKQWYNRKLIKKDKKVKLLDIKKNNIFFFDNLIEKYSNSLKYLNNKKIIFRIKKNILKILFNLVKLENKDKFFKFKLEKNKFIEKKIIDYIKSKKQVLSDLSLHINKITYSNYLIYKIISLKLKKQLIRDLIGSTKTNYSGIIENITFNSIEAEILKNKKKINKVNNKQLYYSYNKLHYLRGIMKKKRLLHIIGKNKGKVNIASNAIGNNMNIIYRKLNKQIRFDKINNFKNKMMQKKLNGVTLNNNFIFLFKKGMNKKNILNVLFHETNANARYIVSDINYKIIHSRSVGSLGLNKEEKKMKRWRKKLGEHLTYWVYKTLKQKENKYDYLYLRTLGKRRIIKPLFYKLKSYLKRRIFRVQYALKKKYNYWKRKKYFIIKN